MRYLLLNTLWLIVAWLIARRRSFKPNQSAVLITLVALYIMMAIFNTYLTSLPIVEYNPAYILGYKILTWPVEDIAYLLVVVMLAPGLYAAFLNHYESTQDTVTPAKTSAPRSKSTAPKRSRRRSRSPRR